MTNSVNSSDEKDLYEVTEPLVSMDASGLHVLDPKISEELAKKNLSPSLVTGLTGSISCSARWFFEQFVQKKIMPPPVDTPATRGSLFHKIMEDFFALPPEERTTARMKVLVEKVLEEDFPEMKDIVDVNKWVRAAINNYYKMGAKPQRVTIADIEVTKFNRETQQEETKTQKGLEIFVKGKIGNTKRPILGFIDRVVVDPNRDDGSVIVEDWKGLHVDTLIPLPNGSFTTMGELKVGQAVLGSGGKSVTITKKSQVHTDRPCYRIEFYDGSHVVCDNVHLWTVLQNKKPVTVDTDELFSSWKRSQARGGAIRIVNAQPIQYTNERAYMPAVKSFEIGVTFNDNTIIPDDIIYGSVNTRTSFLRGFLARNEVEYSSYFDKFSFATTSERVKTQLVRLVSSLGMVLKVRETADTFFLSFSPVGHKLHASQLSEKTFEQLLTSRPDSVSRGILKMEKVDSVATQCIAVDAEDSLYLFGDAMIPTHNTGAKSKHWNPNTKADEGLAEQRQQLIYRDLLEAQGIKVSGARLIYPVAQDIVKVDFEDENLYKLAVASIEEADSKLSTIIETNTAEFSPSHLCAWCPLAKLCPSAQIKPYKKMQDALATQPEPAELLKGIELL